MTHADDERCPVHALCPACARIARDALMAHIGLEPLSSANERAAIVAWLRAEADEPHPVEVGEPALSPSGRGLLLLAASYIERGAHRRGDE